MKDPWRRRKVCPLGWLTVSYLVNDQEVKSHVEECLREECLRPEGLLDGEPQRFSARIGEKLVSKPQAVSAVLRFLEIPRSDFRFVRFNVNNGSHEELPIPPH